MPLLPCPLHPSPSVITAFFAMAALVMFVAAKDCTPKGQNNFRCEAIENSTACQSIQSADGPPAGEVRDLDVSPFRSPNDSSRTSLNISWKALDERSIDILTGFRLRITQQMDGDTILQTPTLLLCRYFNVTKQFSNVVSNDLNAVFEYTVDGDEVKLPPNSEMIVSVLSLPISTTIPPREANAFVTTFPSVVTAEKRAEVKVSSPEPYKIVVEFPATIESPNRGYYDVAIVVDNTSLDYARYTYSDDDSTLQKVAAGPFETRNVTFDYIRPGEYFVMVQPWLDDKDCFPDPCHKQLDAIRSEWLTVAGLEYSPDQQLLSQRLGNDGKLNVTIPVLPPSDIYIQYNVTLLRNYSRVDGLILPGNLTGYEIKRDNSDSYWFVDVELPVPEPVVGNYEIQVQPVASANLCGNLVPNGCYFNSQCQECRPIKSAVFSIAPTTTVATTTAREPWVNPVIGAFASLSVVILVAIAYFLYRYSKTRKAGSMTSLESVKTPGGVENDDVDKISIYSNTSSVTRLYTGIESRKVLLCYVPDAPEYVTVTSNLKDVLSTYFSCEVTLYDGQVSIRGQLGGYDALLIVASRGLLKLYQKDKIYYTLEKHKHIFDLLTPSSLHVTTALVTMTDQITRLCTDFTAKNTKVFSIPQQMDRLPQYLHGFPEDKCWTIFEDYQRSKKAKIFSDSIGAVHKLDVVKPGWFDAYHPANILDSGYNSGDNLTTFTVESGETYKLDICSLPEDMPLSPEQVYLKPVDADQNSYIVVEPLTVNPNPQPCLPVDTDGISCVTIVSESDDTPASSMLQTYPVSVVSTFSAFPSSSIVQEVRV